MPTSNELVRHYAKPLAFIRKGSKPRQLTAITVARRLEAYLKHRGIRIPIVKGPFDVCYVAPFNWSIGLIKNPPSLVYDHNARMPGGLVHELGHLVWGFNEDNEWAFLAWEMTVAYESDVLGAWISCMDDYRLDDESWEDTKPQGRYEALVDSFKNVDRFQRNRAPKLRPLLAPLEFPL